MEEKIFVQMTEKALFDFMLFHTYSKFAGFLSNVLGMAVAFIGIILTIMNKGNDRTTCFVFWWLLRFLSVLRQSS